MQSRRAYFVFDLDQANKELRFYQSEIMQATGRHG